MLGQVTTIVARHSFIPNPGPQPRQIDLGNATYRWESQQPMIKSQSTAALLDDFEGRS